MALILNRQAVFLDKDGTLIEDVPYNVDPDRIRLMPGAAEALAVLHATGYRLFVISNQSGVARGYFQEAALAGVKARVEALLAEAGVPLAGFYYCPHHPEGVLPAYSIACECRKPQSGLILRAAEEHHINLRASWMMGDILDDIEAGRRAGCRTILLDNGNETVWNISLRRWPHYLVTDFSQVPSIILSADSIPTVLNTDLTALNDRPGLKRT